MIPVFSGPTKIDDSWVSRNNASCRGWPWLPVDGRSLVGLSRAVALLALLGCRSRQPDPDTVVPLTVDCASAGTTISPYIYGVAFDPARPDDPAPAEMGATIRRWGGNNTTRYNWRLGAWNTGSDWFFTNVGAPPGQRTAFAAFLAANRRDGMKAAVTLPMLGWVAKDAQSEGFPRTRFPSQQQFAPDRPAAGNGRRPDGTPLPPLPPETTSTPVGPDFSAAWVAALRREPDANVAMYFLDNEPSGWHKTHRDVHPAPVDYDELWAKTLALSHAVRAADPGAVIAGPCEWGWSGYFHSPKDLAEGATWRRPDRRAHGDQPLVSWYLAQAAQHQRATGERLLDVLDLHSYPAGDGIGLDGDGGIDPDTSARRIRATRALWDEGYRDESWIADRVALIPRMRRWAQESGLPLRLSIGEYSFGADGHPSGGLAQAEALGRFGQLGLFSAFTFTYPAKATAAYWAFRAYRNFDGQGGHFLERSLPTRVVPGLSLFASTDEARTKLVLIALNFDPVRARRASIQLVGCQAAGEGRSFRTLFDQRGLGPGEKGALAALPPYSLTVYEIPLRQRSSGPE
jgi:hypothetical protein